MISKFWLNNKVKDFWLPLETYGERCRYEK